GGGGEGRGGRGGGGGGRKLGGGRRWAKPREGRAGAPATGAVVVGLAAASPSPDASPQHGSADFTRPRSLGQQLVAAHASVARQPFGPRPPPSVDRRPGRRSLRLESRRLGIDAAGHPPRQHGARPG